MIKRKYIAIILFMIIGAYLLGGLNPARSLPLVKDESDITGLRVNDQAVSDEKLKGEVLTLLRTYQVQSITNPFPIEDQEVLLTLDYMEGHRPKHIVLGNRQLFYESSEEEVYEIINGDHLRCQLEALLD